MAHLTKKQFDFGVKTRVDDEHKLLLCVLGWSEKQFRKPVNGELTLGRS